MIVVAGPLSVVTITDGEEITINEGKAIAFGEVDKSWWSNNSR
jgi:hypothetical protein